MILNILDICCPFSYQIFQLCVCFSSWLCLPQIYELYFVHVPFQRNMFSSFCLLFVFKILFESFFIDWLWLILLSCFLNSEVKFLLLLKRYFLFNNKSPSRSSLGRVWPIAPWGLQFSLVCRHINRLLNEDGKVLW